MIESAIPDLYRSFASLSPLFGSGAEATAISKLYDRTPEVNFSHRVLAVHPKRLAVIKVTKVRWNDLGEPKRVIASLNMAGVHPQLLYPAFPQFA